MAERFLVANALTNLLEPLLGEAAASVLVWTLLALVLVGLALGIGGIMSYVMRKTMARVQTRHGPNRVGPFGILQFLADGIKLISKEDITPARADVWGYRIAPFLVVLPIIIAMAPLPFGPGILVADIRFGLLFLLAVSAITPIGELVAGWASNNKYSMYGALRAAAMDASYEIPLVMAALSAVLLTSAINGNGLNLMSIVEAQNTTLWFVILQPVGAFIFFAGGLAKAGLIPMDLAEAESELVTGFITEYSGMRFGVFFTGVFISIFFLAALTVTVFFGGWTLPFITNLFLAGGALESLGWLGILLGVFVFLGKTVFFVMLILVTWFTLPRVRVDQFLNVGWKVLFPLALVNFVVTILVIRFALPALGGA